ncbi:flagellar hook-basal body complex protein FliE [Stappia sp. GBMRC 2046]|uniref:Flagellar hook-basal body complex protein FliE n=1 Tax=Stappia sediminis TaxID=2692190 RepID=A0A7X3LRG0_9HYPH|nr:flagellar hook-basal body complex protein FliE [Stappia sediminis]MXN63731.1 flagellar hook-basal body complex protein FliE [Stappia sediminis]
MTSPVFSTPAAAANAYNATAGLTNQVISSQDDETPDFGALVKTAVTSVVEQGREADGKALGLVQGKSDVVDVVTAVAETEVAMETLVSVRDRVISAYQEILRMPI